MSGDKYRIDGMVCYEGEGLVCPQCHLHNAVLPIPKFGRVVWKCGVCNFEHSYKGKIKR